MSEARFLTDDEYAAAAFAALVRAGYPEAEAVKIVDGRFPLLAEDALKEARRRGLDLTMAHVKAFMLAETRLIDGSRMTWRRDGSPFVPEEVWFRRHSLEAMLAWAAKFVPITRPEPAPSVLTVQAMLQGLRSEDQVDRILSGCALAHSLGTGLALSGEHPEDVEHIVAPELTAMLGRAMAGEAAAVDELESLITSDLPEKLRRKGAS